MKKTFAMCLFTIACQFAMAANLTATSSSTGTGLKTGKINLTISGGFAPYIISWTGPGGYMSSKLNPDSLAVGTYCVTVTDQYCGVASICVEVKDQTSSIVEISKERLNVYPNPVKNEFFIGIPDEHLQKNVMLVLYDQLGRKIAFQNTISKKQMVWHFNEEIISGTYILSVEFENSKPIRQKISVIGN